MLIKSKNLLLLSAALSVLLIFTATDAYSQEVLVRKDAFYTEVFLKIPPNEILSVERDNISVVVKFQKVMKESFNRILSDPFIESISGSGQTFKVMFKPTADFAVFNDDEGLRFIATLPKTKDDVLLSYGVGAPLLRKENRYTEDPVVENLLKEADALFRDNKTYQATDKLHAIIATTNNTYYQQEAMFKLGNMYMSLAQTNPNAFIDAANTFDQFIVSFPESNRMPQVRVMAAEAKREAGMMSDAIAAYQAVYNTSVDAETRRNALSRMAEMYTQIGQYDRAIETYRTYLNNFKAGSDAIKVKIGQLYLAREEKDRAYDQLAGPPLETVMDILDENELFTFAKLLEEKGATDRAMEIYQKIAANEESENRPEAFYRMAQIEKAKGNMEAYSKGLYDLSKLFPETEFGLKALVEYAELHYAEKTADEWAAELAPVYIGEDVYDLRHRAQLVQIKALYDDNDTSRLLPMIDAYIGSYSTSPDLPYLLKVKEDVLFTQAVQYQESKNYPRALAIYKRILEEFPSTPRKAQIVQSIDDIYFDLATTLYDSQRFGEAVIFAENHILQEPPVGDRWMTLWEDAVYQNALSGIGAVSPVITRYRSREYLAMMPRGRFVHQFRDILKEAFDYPFKEAFGSGNYAEVIALYDENKGWLDIWPDQAYANTVRVLTATALVRMDMRRQAMDLYQRITPTMTNEYAQLSYSLCQRQTIYDINRFPVDEFNKLIDDAGRCNNPDYVLSLIRGYTADKKAALKAEYTMMKNISDDRKREEVLANIYSQIVNSDTARFDGYQDVYLDAGLAAYRKNDFRGALVPLKQYVDMVQGNDEKKSEALYYLGKSLIALNEEAQGYTYLQQIVDTMQDSVYKNMARNELEDNAWRKSIGN